LEKRKSAGGDDDLSAAVGEMGGRGQGGEAHDEGGGGNEKAVGEFHGVEELRFQQVDARRGGTCAESGKSFSQPEFGVLTPTATEGGVVVVVA
jgi:hypothetical protein